MAKKPPDKGSVLWHQLPEAPEGYTDVKIGIRYVGSHKARAWMIETQKIFMEERDRKMQRGLKEEDGNTIEYVQAFEKLTREVFGDCISGVQCVEGVDENDQAAALELLEYLGSTVEFATLHLCQEQQTLSLRQRFHSEATSN